MATEWKQLGPNQFAIEMHPPLGARLFVGIALSLFAAFFLYYLLTGLYEYVLHATLREWLGAIPGFIVNLIMVLIFALPAAVVFFKKVRVEVDQDSGTIRDVSDYRLFRRSKDYMLNALDAVQTRYYLGSSGDKTQYPYHVQFLFKDGKIITTSVEANEEDAHRLAQKLAQTLHVDVKQFHED
ncbi:hypothetical protein L0152_09015 [bacterium]|nr:hypothetical protein [bacterium]